MSAGKLIQTLEKLLQLHQNLYNVTLQKTGFLKSENVEELKELLKKEQMFVQAIKQVEEERIKDTVNFLENEEELTLSACIEKAVGEEKEKLSEISKEFTETMDKLKTSNQLNKKLTKQALRLTAITLDMIMPQERDFNYNKPAENTKEKQRRSFFDSKA
jgi:flagellar biosynthesis/type III secretory pathway chaperone